MNWIDLLRPGRLALRLTAYVTALAAIALAHNLGLKVIAEGVQTKFQSEVLARHGCDVLQGYWLSRSMDADETVFFLLRNSIIATAQGCDV